MKKKTTKSYKKAFKSIDDFIDIKAIYDDCIVTKDNSIIRGIKVQPIDIWTSSDVVARKIINGIRFAFNKIDFQIYQMMVYSPSSFEDISHALASELDNATDIQTRIILDDIDKMEEFTMNNKKVEFFFLVKSKNERIMNKKYNQILNEFSRVFVVKETTYLDYVNYLNWLFDLQDNFLVNAYYKGEKILDKDMSSDEIREKKGHIDVDIVQEDKNDIKLKYSLFSVKENTDSFEINSKYYSLILVKGLPKTYDVGILNYIGRNQDIKTFFISNNSQLDLVKHIRKENKDLQEKLRIAVIQKNLTEQTRLKEKLDSLEAYATEMIQNKDKTLDFSLALVVSHYESKEMRYNRDKLCDQLRNMGFTVIIPKLLQMALFKYFNPIFNEDECLDSTLKFNIGFPLSTSSYALTYPYHFSTNEDVNGFLYGYEMQMGGRILFNPWLYLDNPDLAVRENRLTGNIIILGETGSGKSTDMYLLFRYFIRRNNFIMWIDPENSNKKETLANGGTYIEFGNQNYTFNLFQLTRVSTDEEDEDIINKIMYDSETAVNNAIDLFKNVLILYNTSIDDNTLGMVGMVANEMYRDFGFLDSEDEHGNIIKAKYPSFKNLKNTDFPTLSDFANTLLKVQAEFEQGGKTKFADALTDLMMKITPMLQEHRHLFDGHTTADIEVRKGNIIGIGTKHLYLKTPNVRNALHYIIYSQAFNYCLDRNVRSVFMFDEAHTTMNDEKMVELLSQFTRRNRKYYNLNVLGTQEPLDMDGEKQQIINQTTYIICKMLTKQNAVVKLEEMLGIDERDCQEILSFEQGDSYFKCGSKKSFFMHTLLTLNEERAKGNNYYNA